MENFFHTLKVALVRQPPWAIRDTANRDLFPHAGGYHNRRRIHSALGYINLEQAKWTAT